MKILITAGPTREKVDPVRYLSNRSSGKMGYALAAAAREAGHEVVLISGPVSLSAPAGVRVIKVESAAEMAAAVRQEAVFADMVIMAAAVADYRPVQTAAQKIKKTSERLVLELEKTEDILAGLGQRKQPGQCLVGFAAETDGVIDYARDKLRRKNLDWIIANDVSRTDGGFEVDTNAVVMIAADGRLVELPTESKVSLAGKILAVLGG